MAELKVGDYVRINGTENTRLQVGLSEKMKRLAEKKAIVQVRTLYANTNEISLWNEDESDFWCWHPADIEPIQESDFHLATCIWANEPATIYRSPANGGWYLVQNYVNSGSPNGDREWLEYGKYTYSFFGLPFSVLLQQVSQVQFKNKLPIQTPATQFKIIPKEKEVKMLEHLSNDQKIQYSKLTTAQKAQYKNGLIDLNGNLTSEGKDFVMAYIIDESKSEALKSINDTLDKVNKEIASKN